MQAEIKEKVEKCIAIAEKFFNTSFIRPQSIIFKRNGTTAGWSNYGKKTLMFQLDLAENNSDHFLNQTVPHEVAHYVQRAVYGYGVKPHGREWKYIMLSVFKIQPDRCHQYDTSVTKKRKVAKFTYTCGCRTHQVSAVKHNRMLLNKARYICNRCEGSIRLVQNTPTNSLTIRSPFTAI
jgi:SprT protein